MLRSPVPHALTERLEELEALDAPAKQIQSAMGRALPPGRVKDALSGAWLGHSVHPLIMLVPLGAWTSAFLLDWLGDEDDEAAVERLLGISLLALAPTVATGASDWVDTWGRARRVGFVHAASNATAAGLITASLAARRRGSRRAGRLLAAAGMGAAALGGYLGGHLSYARGIGVDETAFERLPADWTAIAGGAALPSGMPQAAQAGDVDIVLVRTGDELRALADRCCHRGGPLHEGSVQDGCITCPWHGSSFRLDDGAVVRGPAAYPQPAFEVRERDGTIEVRARRPYDRP